MRDRDSTPAGGELREAMREGLSARAEELTRRPHALPRARAGGFPVRRLVLRLAIGVGIVAIPAAWAWHADAPRRAVRALPPEERRVKYQAARRDFDALCAQPSDALRDHCRSQADLLRLFPACDEDATCHAMTRPYVGGRQPPR